MVLHARWALPLSVVAVMGSGSIGRAQDTMSGPGTGMSPETGSAQSCLAAVDVMARQLGVPSTAAAQPVTPNTPDEATVDPQQLQGSGGVITAPTGGATPVITPPLHVDNMPTAPTIEPSPGEAGGGNGLTASRQAQATSLLQSARAAAVAGNAQECMQHLDQVRALTASPNVPG